MLECPKTVFFSVIPSVFFISKTNGLKTAILLLHISKITVLAKILMSLLKFLLKLSSLSICRKHFRLFSFRQKEKIVNFLYNHFDRDVFILKENQFL